MNDKIIVEDKDGNRKEYPINLDDELKEGEYFIKKDGIWYIHKRIKPSKELEEWLNAKETITYYTLE